MKKIAILQSNYIPWKGYFDLIAAVDEFILYDDVQYTRQDWRNRNRIKTSQGLQWLTVPVKARYPQIIRETELDGIDWGEKHWKSLSQNYRRASFFDEVAAWLEPLYRVPHTHLSPLNRRFLEAICAYLGIKTVISNSWDYEIIEGQTERLVDLCRKAGGTEYVSGPSARDYLDESVFFRENMIVTWFDYSGYQEYPQLWGPFEHSVTVLDLLFNCGKGSASYMKHVTLPF
jgi:hypothetical protein